MEVVQGTKGRREESNSLKGFTEVLPFEVSQRMPLSEEVCGVPCRCKCKEV